MLLVILALTIAPCSIFGLKISIAEDEIHPYEIFKFFKNVSSVIQFNLDGQDNILYAPFTKSLMDRAIPCLGEWRSTTLNISEQNITSSDDGVLPPELSNRYMSKRGKWTGIIVLMSLPEPEKLYTSALLPTTNEQTIFLFYGYSLFEYNDTETVNTIEADLKYFFEIVWSLLKIRRVLGWVVTRDGNPILCTYDADQWHNGTYGVGIRLFTKEQFLEDPSITNPPPPATFPVKIALFERMPTSIKLWDPVIKLLRQLSDRTWGYGGLDGFLLGDTIEALGFQPILRLLEADTYGYTLQNGTVTGSLGVVVNEIVDVSFNSRFIKVYGAERRYNFLNFIHTDKLCLIVPKAGQIPLWHNVLRVYDIGIWTTLATQTIVIGLLRWLQIKMTKKNISYSLIRVMLDTHCMIVVPVYGVVRSSVGERLLLLPLLIINLVLVSLFQGNLHAAFSTTKYYQDLETLDEVDRSEIDIRITQGFRDVFDVFDDNTTDSTLQRLNLKIKTDSHSGVELENIAQGDWKATLARSSDVVIQIKTDYLGAAGQPLLHVVEECPRTFLLAYIMRNNFPFQDDIDRVMIQLFEAGLPRWYYEMTEYVLTTRNQTRLMHLAAFRSGRVLQFRQMSGAFIILGIGVVISTVILLGEIITHARCGETHVERE